MHSSSTRLALLSAVASTMLLASAASAVAAGGETTVSFIEPERFTDARLNRPAGGADAIVLATVERHLQQLGGRCLPAGQSLELRIHDIDLAGRVEWWHGPSRQTRIMREVTWPRIRLSYALREAGRADSETSQEIRDIDYLSGSPVLRAESTPLPYERAMLTRWFERQFCNR